MSSTPPRLVPPARLRATLLDAALELARADRGAWLAAGPSDAHEVLLARALEGSGDAEDGRGLSTPTIRRVLSGGRGAIGAEDEGGRAVLCVPLPAAAGLLYLDRHGEAGAYAPDDLRLVEGFATHAGRALVADDPSVQEDALAAIACLLGALGPAATPALETAEDLTVVLLSTRPLLRAALGALLGDGYRVREASAASEISGPADLVVLDLVRADAGGLDALKALAAGATPVLALGSRGDPQLAERCLRAGARGYASVDDDPSEFRDAVRRVARGARHVSAPLAKGLLERLLDDRSPEPVAQLSDRELQVFELLGEGMATREIADRLTLSVKTIETHREHIKRKLGVRSASQLVHRATLWRHERGLLG